MDRSAHIQQIHSPYYGYISNERNKRTYALSTQVHVLIFLNYDRIIIINAEIIQYTHLQHKEEQETLI